MKTRITVYYQKRGVIGRTFVRTYDVDGVTDVDRAARAVSEFFVLSAKIFDFSAVYIRLNTIFTADKN